MILKVGEYKVEKETEKAFLIQYTPNQYVGKYIDCFLSYTKDKIENSNIIEKYKEKIYCRESEFVFEKYQKEVEFWIPKSAIQKISANWLIVADWWSKPFPGIIVELVLEGTITDNINSKYDSEVWKQFDVRKIWENSNYSQNLLQKFWEKFEQNNFQEQKPKEYCFFFSQPEGFCFWFDFLSGINRIYIPKNIWMDICKDAKKGRKEG